MKLILLKVHEEYENHFNAYITEKGYYSIEVARTGDYLEYGHSLHIVYCKSQEVEQMIDELKKDSEKHCDESFTNIEIFVLRTKEDYYEDKEMIKL